MEEGKHKWKNYFFKIYPKLRSFKIINFILASKHALVIWEKVNNLH